MSDRLVQLAANLEKVLGKRAQSIEIALGEVTVVVNANTYFESAILLRDEPSLAFEHFQASLSNYPARFQAKTQRKTLKF